MLNESQGLEGDMLRMKVDGWKYYNHALIPTCEPHDTPDTFVLQNDELWDSEGKRPLLARWTTDWDCGLNTNWWYVIKDEPFDISKLKADKRYKINKGLRYFEVRVINPLEHAQDLYNITVKAISTYPKKNQNKPSFEKYIETINEWKQDENVKIYAAFYRETEIMCGFIVGIFCKSHFELSSQKADPEYEKYQVNAAMIYMFLKDNEELLRNGMYCNDGARSINHETNFQDYLEQYFGFRKAYCRLNIKYKKGLKQIIRITYPIRRFFLCFDRLKIVHLFNSIMKMEEICRNARREKKVVQDE